MTSRTSEMRKFEATLDNDLSVFRAPVATPLANTRRDAARNDDAGDDRTSVADELDAWARHALNSNGFGDAAVAPSAPQRPSSYEMYREARTYRSYALGEIVAEAAVAVVDAARHAVERYRRQRAARASYRELSQLDDHILRDLGLDRSELRSLAAEMSGDAERTRVRTWMTSQGLPY